MTARWIPHSFKVDRKPVKIAQIYPMGFYLFVYCWRNMEHTRKCSNKIWAGRSTRRPTVEKKTLSVKKVMYAIFLKIHFESVLVLIPHGRTITGKLYRNLVLKKKKQTKCVKIVDQCMDYVD